MARETLTVTLYDDETDAETTVTVPSHFVVCGCCNGRGKTTLHGIAITSDEFNQWSPDEREGYFSGDYDTTCTECKGQRVVLVVDLDACTPDIRKALEEDAEAERQIRAEEAAERRFGC